jgi:hypothetical protein
MKKILAILAIISMLIIPTIAAASDCINTVPAAQTVYNGGYDGYGYCCPFPIVAQAQGVAANVAFAYECMTLTTTLAAGQIQVMAGAHNATQIQNQGVSYANGVTQIEVFQSQFQQVGCCNDYQPPRD